MDESLPCSLIDVLQYGLQTASILVVVSISNPWMILAVGPCASVTFYLARYFRLGEITVMRMRVKWVSKMGIGWLGKVF